MKQKSIFALVLGAILVLTVSSMDVAFADYERYDDRDDSYEKEHDRNDDRNESDDRYDDDKDDNDKSEREERRS